MTKNFLTLTLGLLLSALTLCAEDKPQTPTPVAPQAPAVVPVAPASQPAAPADKTVDNKPAPAAPATPAVQPTDKANDKTVEPKKKVKEVDIEDDFEIEPAAIDDDDISEDPFDQLEKELDELDFAKEKPSKEPAKPAEKPADKVDGNAADKPAVAPQTPAAPIVAPGVRNDGPIPQPEAEPQFRLNNNRGSRLGAPGNVRPVPGAPVGSSSEERRRAGRPTSLRSTPPPGINSTNAPVAGNANGSTNILAEPDPVAYTTQNLENPDELIPIGAWQIQNMPLDAFLDVYSDLVGLTVIRPATLPQAQINFKMKTPLTKRDLVRALEGVLMVNQITIIPSGDKFVTATPLADAPGMGAKINELDPKEIPESLQFMTQIVQLKNALPSEVVASIQPFAKIPNGIVTLDEAKLLVIRDYSVNVKRMIEIIKRVDVVPEDDYKFMVIPIKYGEVASINDVMSSLVGGSSGGVSSSRTTGGLNRTGTSNSTYRNNRSNSSLNRNNNNSSSLNRSSSSSRYTGSQANMQRIGGNTGGGMNSFQNRMGNIMNRAGANSQAMASLLMDEAQIIPDERSNSLIVYATKRDMEVITNVVNQLDFMLPQVLIESVIVSVSVSDSFNLKVSGSQNQHDGENYSDRGAMNNGLQTIGSGGTNSLPISGASGMPEGFSYFGKIGDDWEFSINALAKDNQATVLQRPRIQTVHGVSAEFFNGQEIPYASSSYYGYSSASSVSYSMLEVGISLSVTPYITPDDLVLMEIQQDIDEFDQWVTMGNDVKAPQTVKRNVSSYIMVKDGESILLGGFIRMNKTQNKSGVPYLKDIPLLGYLFRSTSKSNERSELLVFIRPSVVDSPDDMKELMEVQSKSLPGAYFALKEYDRTTKNQMLTVLEYEKTMEMKEKYDLLKFQERMKKLDEKAEKSNKKLEEKRKEKDIKELSQEEVKALTGYPIWQGDSVTTKGESAAPAKETPNTEETK